MSLARLASGFATAALLWGAAAPSGNTPATPPAGVLGGFAGVHAAAAAPAGAWLAGSAPIRHFAGADVRAEAPAPSLPSRVHGLRRALVRIPAGSYLPLYTPGGRTDERTPVGAFELDAVPVTRREFAAFVAAHPEWRRSRVALSATARGYLSEWAGDLDYGSATDGDRPVTEVPLAAARAFCAAEGRRLPSTEEWEYAAAAGTHERDASSDPAFRQRLLELYTRPRPDQPAPVRSIFRNAYGVWDLHGLVWEWTDGAQSMEHGKHHDDSEHAEHHHPDHASMPGGAHKHDMGCAGTAVGASDTRAYAAFLRYAFREALTPSALSPALGFRCAR